MAKQTRDELLAAGKRAAYKNQCQSVIVAPDHTGEDNYHNCFRAPHDTGTHYCGCGHSWNEQGALLDTEPP